MVRMLISGLLPHESGKTWVGLTLTRKLVEAGIKVGVFKPVAGHNAWYQYRTVVESLSRGVLVGEDIVRYLGIVKDLDVEISNPIDILLAPPSIEKYLKKDVESYLDDLENQFKQMVLARVSTCIPRYTNHYVFKENLDNISPYLKEVLEKLVLKLKAIDISIENFIKILRTPKIEDMLSKCLEVVEQGKDVVIIESFNNAIAPYTRILRETDMILIVSPSTILIYKDKVGEVLSTLTNLISKVGEKGFETINIVTKLKPDEILHVKPRLDVDEDDESLNTLALKIFKMLG
jgi:predicted P-loop ATPase/GTPase